MPATANLQMTETNHSANYRLCLNVVASAPLKDVEYCQLIKTEKFIIIKPVLYADKDEANEKRLWHVCRSRGRYVNFSLMRWVGDGTIRKAYFRTKYKVKRDKNGWLYVCLNEPIGGDSDS